MTNSVPNEPALSRIGPREVLTALALPVEGRTFDLGLELNEDIPQGAKGVFVPFHMTTRASPEKTAERGPFQYSVEAVTGTLHVSTHIDALVHIQAEGRIFGGALATEARNDRGWKQYGAETISPIITRGVLLDVAGTVEADALADRYEITIDDLRKALAVASAEVQPGDAVLVRTGKIREFYTDPAAFEAAQPGVGIEAAVWLHDRGMAVLGTGTTGTEPQPFPDPARTTHRAMLVERGVHLIENLFLDELAAAQVRTFLFVCLPLKITGATGSWVRPIAVV